VSVTKGVQISLIVPTYRRPALLSQCLDSLTRQDAPAGSFEIVVVDDGSGDATSGVLERAADTLPALTWATQPVNAGPAAARNRAVAMSSGRLLLFIDDDVVASPTLVSTHLRLHERAPENVGVVGLVEWLPALTVTPFMHWLDRTTYQFAYARMTAGPLAHPADAFYTCNLSMRRTIFDASGGFDERFPYPAYEDTELACRLADAGFELHYRPEALAWHARAITLREFSARMGKVAESAVLWHRAQPNAPISVEGMSPGARPLWFRLLLRAVAPVVPHVLGRDLRASYYRATVASGYAKGLARARAHH
jgi:GT2 family glycosyltransferase